MSKFDLDLTDVATGEDEPVTSLSKEELVDLKAEFDKIKAKVDSKQEITLEEQRIVIAWCRADREVKFVLNKLKPKAKKERKVKKVSRAKLIELIEKEELDDFDKKDLEYTLSLYKGKKLTKKALSQLFLKEHQSSLNEVEEIDKEFNLFTEVE